MSRGQKLVNLARQQVIQENSIPAVIHESTDHSYSACNLEQVTDVNSVNSSIPIIVINVPADEQICSISSNDEIANNLGLSFSSLESNIEIPIDENVFDNFTIVESCEIAVNLPEQITEQGPTTRENQELGRLKEILNIIIECDDEITEPETVNNDGIEHKSTEEEPATEGHHELGEGNEIFNMIEHNDETTQPDTDDNNGTEHLADNVTQSKRKKRHHVNPSTWKVNKLKSKGN